MPNRSYSAGLVARPFLLLATGLLVSAVAVAEDGVASAPSALPILVWLALPLLLGGASIVAAVLCDILWRGLAAAATARSPRVEAVVRERPSDGAPEIGLPL